ncbi:hypothetical protein V8E36_003299 [Tilletia maclaganii]
MAGVPLAAFTILSAGTVIVDTLISGTTRSKTGRQNKAYLKSLGENLKASTTVATVQGAEIVAFKVQLAASVELADAKERANAILSEQVTRCAGQDEEMKQLINDKDAWQKRLNEAKRG